MRWLEEVEGGFALGAGKIGDEAREREAAYPLGAKRKTPLDLL